MTKKGRKIRIVCLSCDTMSEVFSHIDGIYKDDDGEYKTFAWCLECLTTRNCKVLEEMEFVFR